MESYIFFFAGLSFILVHEMDAVKCHEWTILPLVSRLAEKTGYIVFTVLHVALYLLLFRGIFDKNGINQNLVIGLDIFFIIHIFLHVIYFWHPKNQFKSVFSWIIILGAGIAGLLDMFTKL
jgi:hypothetical protein